MNQHLRDLLSESQILQISADIAAGIAYMHYLDQPLVHRDLKIENVLISSDGVYKLCDFGSASAVIRPPRNAQEYQILEHDIQNRTTMQYRSPEMVDLKRAFPIDEKSDIWAFGVFVYKLCYYTTPFEKEGDPAILKAKYSFPPAPLFSERLKRLISVCLNEDPRNRPNIYQVLKELYDMRGNKLTLPDIYVSPTSTQRIAQATPALPPSAATPIPSSSGGLLDPTTPASRSAVDVSLVSTQSQSLSSGQQKLNSALAGVQSSSNKDQAYVSASISNSSANLLSDKLSSVSSLTGKSRDENDLELDTTEDAALKFPTIEQITLSLENQGLNQSQPQSSKPVPYSKPARNNINTGGLTHQYQDTKSASASPNDNKYIQPGVSPFKPITSVSKPYYEQPQYRPQMVSHSTMTSPIASRSHTPSSKVDYKTLSGSRSQYPPKISSVDVSVGTDDFSSSSDDEYVEGVTKSFDSSRNNRYIEPKPYNRSSDAGPRDKGDSYTRSIAKQPPTVLNRDSEDGQNSKTVTKFTQNEQFESLIAVDDYKPDDALKKTTSRNNIPLKQPSPQQEVKLIEPLENSEKDHLKDLLSGLDGKSSTVVLGGDDEYINNSVDFLKALNKESTGRSRHSRSPSRSPFTDDPSESYPTTANSNKKPLSHSKKSSLSLKHTVSTKLGEAFKKFENSKPPGFTRQNQRSSYKTDDSSYSPEVHNTYESDPEDFGSHPKLERLHDSNDGLKRYQSTRVASSNSRSVSNVQSRIQAYMNSRNDTPAPKTASGYGKYTDVSPEDNKDSTSDEEVERGLPTHYSSPYSNKAGFNNKPERLSAEFPTNEYNSSGRKSFEAVLRNSEKIKEMASNPVTVSLSGDLGNRDSSSPDSSEPSDFDSVRHKSPKKHSFLGGHKDRKFSENRSPRYKDDPDHETSSDEEVEYPRHISGRFSDNRLESRPLQVPSSPQPASHHDSRAHRRQISTISSTSLADGSSYQHTGTRKPPKPAKPVHLQSPRRKNNPGDTKPAQNGIDKTFSPLSNALLKSPRKYNGNHGKLSNSNSNDNFNDDSRSLKQVDMVPSTGTHNRNSSNLIEISPDQSPKRVSNDDWKEMFNNKYPSVV